MEEKLRRGVESLDKDVDELLPFLRELFQLPGENDAVRHLDPQTKRRRTFEAIRSLTMAAARTRPLVLALEDLHWADRTTEDYLGFLARRIVETPILVITTQRPGYAVRWADEPWYTPLVLELLGHQEVETLIKSVLGASEIPEKLLRSVLEKAEGNPLAIEEIAASLLERGIVVRREDGVRWIGDVTIDFPATIQDIVRARIDRLAEEVKTTLQNAAAIGRRFGATLLAAISDPLVEVSIHLATLKQLELVYETRSFPEAELAFKHAVIQDVAYQTLLARRRSDLHVAIGQVIEQVYADQIDDHLDLLVHH